MGDALVNNGMLVGAIIMAVLSGLAVFLRFSIRAKSKTPLAADDWWALASLVFFYVTIGAEIWLVIELLENPVPSPDLERRIRKVVYAVSSMPCSTTAAAKISFLCLYVRLFPIQSFQRKCSFVKGLTAAAWAFWIIGFYFQCRPIRGAWEPSIPKHCINIAALFLGLEIFSCILDIILICLPIKMIRGLQMAFKRKMAMATIFILGILVLIAGIVRMALLYQAKGTTLSLKPNIITTTVENTLHIICACIPTYGPLLSRFKTAYLNAKAKRHSLASVVSGRGPARLTGHYPPCNDGEHACHLYHERTGKGSLLSVIRTTRTDSSTVCSAENSPNSESGYAFSTFQGPGGADAV